MLSSGWSSGESGRGSARPFYRSRYDRLVFGVCGGVAEYFGWEPKLVRLAFACLLILAGPLGLAAYAIFVAFTSSDPV